MLKGRLKSLSKQGFTKLTNLLCFFAEEFNAWEVGSGGRGQLTQVKEDRSDMLCNLLLKHSVAKATTSVFVDLKAHPETAGPIC